MNGYYIREMGAEELADTLLEFWQICPPPEIPALPSRELALQIAPLVQERLKTLRDAAPLVAFLFKSDIEYDSSELIQRRMDADSTRRCLEVAYDGLAALDSFDAEPIEALLRGMVKELDVKGGSTFRVAAGGYHRAARSPAAVPVAGSAGAGAHAGFGAGGGGTVVRGRLKDYGVGTR